jgi:hypothetical protein
VESNSSTSHSKTALSLKPLGLLIVLLVLTETAMHFLPEGFMTQTMVSRLREITSLPVAPVQLMGDSVSAAVNPAVVATKAGLPAEAVSNYSLPGTSPLFAYFTLRREIAAGKVPKIIIFAPHPANLNAPMIDRFIGRFATVREAMDLLANRVSPAECLFGALCRVSYTLRYREELQAFVTQGNRDFFHTWHSPIASIAAAPLPTAEPEPEQHPNVFTEGTLAPQLITPFFVAPDNAIFIDKFCDLAAAHGIRVLWVSMPTIPLLAKRGSGDTRDGKYFAYLESVARRHGNVTILHREIDIMPDAEFSDARHLNRHGAWVFSQQLGDWLGQRRNKQPDVL